MCDVFAGAWLMRFIQMKFQRATVMTTGISIDVGCGKLLCG